MANRFSPLATACLVKFPRSVGCLNGGGWKGLALEQKKSSQKDLGENKGKNMQHKVGERKKAEDEDNSGRDVSCSVKGKNLGSGKKRREGLTTPRDVVMQVSGAGFRYTTGWI